MHKFALLRPADVRTRWGEIAPLLAAAVAHGLGELEVDDILGLVEKNRMCVLVLEQDGVVELALAAEVARYPKKSVLRICYAGGKNGAVVARRYYPTLEQIGRVFGASAVECWCRPSVARYLKRLFPDVHQAYVVMQREVQA